MDATHDKSVAAKRQKGDEFGRQHAANGVTSFNPSACSPLEEVRRSVKPSVPSLLLGRVKIIEAMPTTCVDSALPPLTVRNRSHLHDRRNGCTPPIVLADQEQIAARFPNLYGQPVVDLVADENSATGPPLRVGCVLSGGRSSHRARTTGARLACVHRQHMFTHPLSSVGRGRRRTQLHLRPLRLCEYPFPGLKGLWLRGWAQGRHDEHVQAPGRHNNRRTPQLWRLHHARVRP